MPSTQYADVRIKRKYVCLNTTVMLMSRFYRSIVCASPSAPACMWVDTHSCSKSITILSYCCSSFAGAAATDDDHSPPTPITRPILGCASTFNNRRSSRPQMDMLPYNLRFDFQMPRLSDWFLLPPYFRIRSIIPVAWIAATQLPCIRRRRQMDVPPFYPFAHTLNSVATIIICILPGRQLIAQ